MESISAKGWDLDVSCQKVIVTGAAGKMGSEVCRTIQSTQDLILVGGVDPYGQKLSGVKMFSDLNAALEATNPDVVVDFTTAQALRSNLEICYQRGLPMVVGTTGLSQEDLQTWQKKADDKKWPVIIAPNFAIGAVLMM